MTKRQYDRDRARQLGGLDKRYLATEQIEDLSSEVDCFLDTYVGGETSQIFILYGFSGVGKTSFLAHYLNETFKRAGRGYIESEDGLRLMVVSVPSDCTPRGLASRALKAIGDPLYKKGTAQTMTDRLYGYMSDLHIDVMVFDELNNFIDTEKKKVNRPSTGWLKQVVNEIQVAVIVAGLPSMEEVFSGNTQLDRRTLTKYEMEPFDFSTKKSRDIFQSLLLYLAQAMPFANATAIALEPEARRIHAATGGYVGLVVPLLKAAGTRALRRGGTELDSRDFFDAFNILKKRKRAQLAGVRNPFGEL